MPTVQILYWYDIPLQVRVREKRNRVSRELPKRFQLAVDNAAMKANLVGDEAYLDGLRWSDPETRNGTLEEIANAAVAELEAAHPKIDWQATATSILNTQTSTP
jgi:hypothetical protein